MKTTLRVTGILVSALITLNEARGQDIHFSQLNQLPLGLNPAMAGTTVWIRAATAYRTQWRAVTQPYKTIGASFDIKTKKRWVKFKRSTERYRQSADNGFGWGVLVLNDRAGDGKMGTFQVNGSMAYQLMMSKESMFALGFQGGLVQRTIKFDNLTWGTQYDVSAAGGFNPALMPDKGIANGSSNYLTFDLAAGGLYSYKRNEKYMRGNDQLDITLGAAMYHLNGPKNSYLGTNHKMPMRYSFHGNGIIGIENTNLALAPSFVYFRQGPNSELLFGSLLRYMLREDSRYTGYVKGSSISGGVYYRNNDALIAAVLYEFSSYGIGISYDFNVSGLKSASYGRGGLEFTLRFTNPSPFIYSRASFNR